MKGAIAAGHPLTARAGARILEEGGNAVDACIAAACVSWVAESTLTGPGGGGFLLVHRASASPERADTVLDFFVAVPGRGSTDVAGEMEAVDVSFDGITTQRFLVGAAACAVPGSVAGLVEAHRLYARLPWRVLLESAVELAEDGIELSGAQGFLHEVLDPILRFAPASRRVYGEECALRTGETLRLGDLAGTLRWLAEEGAPALYRGELATRLSEAVRESGGILTEQDLAEYRVIRRRPVRTAYRGHEFVSNPPPSSGGLLIAFALAVLDRLGPRGGSGAADEAAVLVEVMRQASLARRGSFVSSLYRGGLAGRLLAEDRVEDSVAAVRSATRVSAREPSGLPSTTHVSAVDADGNAASVSASTGCGSGIVAGGTGIHLNNMLGEIDLNPGGDAVRPGRRLTSMMAPSLLLSGGRPRLVVGSAGSERLRGAILQIILNVVDRGMRVEEAIPEPRIHLDGDRLHLEGGMDAGLADELEKAGYDVVRWADRNLYFGGAAAVAVGESAELEAAGDLRRGGAGLVVE